ncbi:MAG TPA: uroporphyrinogen decarboxylase family protein [Planctomycetota bacterium]|nr:uroporphyrinogen decarboxylase family protein [Planctomycetota bacterium]
MNAKENALRIIRFDRPERIVGAPPCRRISYLGCDHQGYAGGGHHLPVGSQWTDIWGTVWHREHDGVMGFPRGNPLANLAGDLPGFRWPDPDDERICGQIYEQARGWDRASEFLTGSHRDTLWEKSYMLVGMEELMCAFYAEPAAVRDLLHGIMDFQLGLARHYLKLGVEMVSMGDDLGTQGGLLLSPEILQEFLVPEYRRLFELYRRHGVLINFHSCGHITPILEMFMDLGVNILNPVQATANDLDEVRRATQGRMALQGGVSSAVIVAGPPEEIRREAVRRMWQLGREGGYFCSPDQGMPWPEEHIQALHEAVSEHGAYPLRDPGETYGARCPSAAIASR